MFVQLLTIYVKIYKYLHTAREENSGQSHCWQHEPVHILLRNDTFFFIDLICIIIDCFIIFETNSEHNNNL